MNKLLCAVVFGITVLVGLIFPREAAAYPWMIREGYTGCNQCHTDPSGGGLLTKYGRDQGDLELRTRYGDPSQEVSKAAGFLWGAVTPPPWLILGGEGRLGVIRVAPEGTPAAVKLLHMQSDVRAQVNAGGFRANVSLGFMASGGQPAWVTRAAEGNLVSREHWLGYQFGDESSSIVLVRAGRINLPFGIRDIMHTLYVRSSTRTDINEGQQHGAAVAYVGDKTRGEFMGIAGNFQTSPDAYRERGYSGYIERAIMPTLAVGVSSLTTYSKRDPRLFKAGTRMAHGLFGRWNPTEKLVLMAEGDGVFFLPSSGDSRKGFAGMLQADVEVVQGFHLFGTGEVMDLGGPRSGTLYGGWLSAAWFFAPHADVRIDAIEQSVPAGPDRLLVFTLLSQLHVYL
jgi:hypothetical protein